MVKLWIILIPIYQATRKIIEYDPKINCPFLFIELSTRGGGLDTPPQAPPTQNLLWGIGREGGGGGSTGKYAKYITMDNGC